MIYIIAGQTASGKSNLALEFAKKIGGVILNGDAFQVYQRLDIGTAKPSLEERQIVPHYLFDIVTIDHGFSIFEYQQLARAKIDECIKNCIPVVIVGGSGLYIRSVLFDYRFTDNTPIDMSEFESKSNVELHDYLQQVDKESASKIHANNRRRVLRAIEIYRQTGRAKSELENSQDKHPHYPYLMVGLSPLKEQLDEQILNRVKTMFNKGLKEEVMTLLKAYDPTSPGFKAIGYKEIIANPSLMDEALIELIAKNTRQYAKRQMTFFKNQFTIQFFPTHDQALHFLMEKHKELNYENN